jgi:hypothetical protein
VSIFKAIKVNQSQPDAELVASYGATDTFDDDISLPGDEDESTLQAKDMLLRMPGVLPSNVSNLLKKVKNIGQISLMTASELSEILGVTCGVQLFNFLHEKYV